MSFQKYEDAKSMQIPLEALSDSFETSVDPKLNTNAVLNYLGLKNTSQPIGFECPKK